MSLLAKGIKRMREKKTTPPKNARSCKPIPDDLISLVRRRDARLEEPRGKDGAIHVSALVSTGCARKLALEISAAREGTAKPASVSSDMRVVWTMGRAAEKHVRQAWIEELQERAFGSWQCRCGKTTSQNTFFSPDAVAECCGGKLDQYIEIDLQHAGIGLTGHPDFVCQAEDGLRVVEIKSINASGFDSLKEPKPQHVAQLLHYIDMMPGVTREKISPIGHVFYVRKEFSFKGVPYKSFDIDSSAPVHKMALESGIDRADSVRTYLDGGKLPSRLGQCKTPNTPTAKKCGACELCFSYEG